jgi:kinesin family protein 18/19
MAELFRKIDDRRTDQNIDIYVTFLEIYNEEIRDLLADPATTAPRGGLQIREDKAVKVVGLTELHPTSTEQIKEIVLLGNTRRTQSPTHANETSSRSHAVLQVHVTQSPRTASTTEERTAATLSIIDLAGSERAAATTNMGQRMVEGANINKSLLALGNCINALCESGGGTRHVPYRNSKLTRLLKFSLGGNCKTVMIVCIAPTSNHFDDTHNTLLYADRASKIKTKVVTRNVVNVDRHVGQYVEAINRLNMEVAELKARLAGKLSSDADLQRRKREDAKAEVERAKSDMSRKADQTLPTILEGVRSNGSLDLARISLQAYSGRREEIRATEREEGILSPKLAAEQALLNSLIVLQEGALRPTSPHSVSVQRSSNAESMFEATLRAVLERKSDRMDDVAIESVKVEAKYRKEYVERQKADAYCDSLKKVVTIQAQLITKMIGVLARCTSALEGANKELSVTPQDLEDATQRMCSIAGTLHTEAENTNHSLHELIGGSMNLDSITTLPDLTPVPTQYLAPPQAHDIPVRASTHGAPMRRAFRSSPRKPRTSLAPTALRPTARRSSGVKPPEKKKGVQWRDQVSRDDIEKELVSVIHDVSIIRSPSACGSESEWEDEKTEESMSASFASASSSYRDGPPIRTTGRRARASRLDPSFLKSRPSPLSSLVESDEPNTSVTGLETRRESPLMDRANLSQLPTPPDSSTSKASETTTFIPSPSRREKRRRSNVGPLRHERARRRSSQLPIPSPPAASHENAAKNRPRRVPVTHTPVKSVKRVSIGSARPSTSMRMSFLRGSLCVDPNQSAQLSFKGTKPSWR